jgi:hypothetical protein
MVSKLYTNCQQMKVYMLIVYIIHMECYDIMLSRDLWLDVACNFTYATHGINYNLFLIKNYSRKLRLFF